MNNGFDYITSGYYAGDWLQIQFLAETVATLTPHTGDSVTGTFAAGQQLVGTFVEVNVTSGVMLAYRRGATAKRSLIDADFQAVLNRGTTLGYSLPTGTALTAGNQLVKDLKNASIWNKLDVFYVFATNGDSDFATLNWKTPASFQATKVNSPTFTSLEGFTGNGTSSYLDTNFNLLNNSVNYTQDSASIGVYDRVNNGGNMHRFGVSQSTPANGVLSNWNRPLDNEFAYINSAFPGNFPVADLTINGFHFLNRTDSSNFQLYGNGNLYESGTQTSTSLANGNVFVLAFNRVGTGAQLFYTGQISVFFAGASLASEASAFFTAIEAYMDAIGKGVVA